MIIYDTHALETHSHLGYNTFPRVIIELYPGMFGRWRWEVHVSTGEPVWTHWQDYDGSRWGFKRACQAGQALGYEIEYLADKELKGDTMEETRRFRLVTAAGDFITESMTEEIFSSLLRGEQRNLSSTFICREDKGNPNAPYTMHVLANSVIAYRKLPTEKI